MMNRVRNRTYKPKETRNGNDSDKVQSPVCVDGEENQPCGLLRMGLAWKSLSISGNVVLVLPPFRCWKSSLSKERRVR